MKLYTSQFNYSGDDRLDITVKTKDPLGKIFAPTWDIVIPYKQKTLTEKEYTEIYLSRMRESYKNYLAKWQTVLNKNLITLVCYCRKGQFCHRLILANILQKLGAEYVGEK